LSTSHSERKFILDGVACGVRADGRALLSRRHIELRMGVLPQANGSCRVRHPFSATDVLCSVKVEIGPVFAVDCSVELNASVEQGKEFASDLCEAMRGAFDKDKLTVVPHRAAWCVYVDCVVLGGDGCLTDLLSLAAHCAIRNALIPATSQLETEDGLDFELNQDLGAALSLESFCTVGFTLSAFVINGKLLVDATAQEEMCCDCALAVAVGRDGRVRGIAKRGPGALPVEAVAPALAYAASTARVLFELIDAEVERAKDRAEAAPTVILNKAWLV